jgi:riboflavin kinase/FMN adenylyltransferase
MIVLTRLCDLSQEEFPRLVLTLGAFDGIHLGHQRVLARVVEEARKIRGTPALLTFQEHPQKVLRPEARIRILTSFRHKLSLIREAGIRLVLALRFDLAFSRFSPREFVARILVDRFHVTKVILGHDARFGHGREGDAEIMAKLAGEHGFEFEAVPPVRKGRLAVKSTLIRRLIERGDFNRAEKLLGRPYSVMCGVVKGKRRGRVLGFPTANLDPHGEVLPPHGVYAVKVRIVRFKKIHRKGGFLEVAEVHNTGSRPGVLNLGTRPTFDFRRARPLPEVHVLEFSGNLYGKEVEVEFVRKLREEKRFPDPASLARQISRDVVHARRALARVA